MSFFSVPAFKILVVCANNGSGYERVMYKMSILAQKAQFHFLPFVFNFYLPSDATHQSNNKSRMTESFQHSTIRGKNVIISLGKGII